VLHGHLGEVGFSLPSFGLLLSLASQLESLLLDSMPLSFLASALHLELRGAAPLLFQPLPLRLCLLLLSPLIFELYDLIEGECQRSRAQVVHLLVSLIAVCEPF
jgi:hypothetical protein